jgi:hypothetical protein
MKRKHLLLMRLTKPSHTKLALFLLVGALLVSPVDLKREALAITPTDVCLTQAVAQINKVLYLGKNSAGQDEVEVDWLAHSISECVVVGSGQDVPGKADIAPSGYEVTVKIKRRLGHEDSATVRTAAIVRGDVKTIVRIPRANLETDPVSFEAKVKTTAGAVLRTTAHVSGNGAPSLSGATQTFTKTSTVPNTPDGCHSTVQVSALNFIPGSGATPHKVTVNWGSGAPPLGCFESPKFSVLVRIRRPDGGTDSARANFDAGTFSATLQLLADPVASFDVFVTTITGTVLDKTGTQSGNF